MIGNDLVDLSLASRQSNWRRKGFLGKVFSSKEQELILKRTASVWHLWSMKEAAYKVHQRTFELPRRINWLSHECEIWQGSGLPRLGSVKVEGHRYYTSTETIQGAIHTTASAEKETPVKTRIFSAPSKFAKEKLLAELAREFSISREELSIEKNPHGVPVVVLDGREFFSAFSCSDHGRFSAFSLSLIMS